MKEISLFALSLCVTASLAADFNPFEGPKPIAVFIQSDPWAMVIGADTPRVAIYEGGDAIFAKKIKEAVAYQHVTLDEAGLAAFWRQAGPVTALKALKSDYNIAPAVTDQPEAMFYLRDGTRAVTTTVYGLMVPGTKLPGWTTFPGRPKLEKPPDQLLQLHKWLCAFDRADSEPWTPKYVEVMFWDYSYAPDPSIQWPKDWPTFSSDRAIKRRGAYSIFLDGSLLPKLQKFLETRKEKGAVELGGTKWAVSYRPTFPSEPLWRAAFSKVREK